MTDRAGCIEVLCYSGANINAATSGGATALHIAASWGNLATVKVLTQYPQDLTSTLKSKFKKERIATVLSDLLVGPIADLSCKDSDGKRAIEVAAQKRQLKVVEFLLKLE